MESYVEIYQTATKRFLQKFDLYWNNALKELDNKQAQLVAGNRLRPQICLWGYLSTISPDAVKDCNFDQIANIAVSIELIHKASLLLDDWIDNDKERHGQPAFYVEYGVQYTVLFALNMISFSMFRLENAFSDSVVLPHHYELCLNMLIRTIHSMANGAIAELRLQREELFDNEKIRAIVQHETADILGNSMLIGYYAGIENGRNTQIERAFKKQGDLCGYLFQALNDLEAFVDPQQLKAHKGALNLDLLLNRKNLAVSSLYQVASKKDQACLWRASEADLQHLMKKYHIVESLRNELETVYDEILSEAASLQAAGLLVEWCEGFCWFLGRVKKYAEERLT